MKKIVILVIGLTIAMTSLYAAAREGDSERLAGCESRVQALYGEDAGVKLKSLSHKRGGTFIRLKVKPVDSDRQLLTCRVDKAGVISLTDSNGVALVAPGHTAAEQVSLAAQ